MIRRKKRPPRRQRSASIDPLPELDLYLETWMALTPRERLRRSWRLRSRLKNLRAIHDAKTFPEL